MIEITAQSWLREGAGYTEDGHRPVVEDFIVWATYPDGSRLQHRHVFAGSVSYSEDGFARGLPGNRHLAETFARKVQRAVNAGRQLNPAHWVEVQAAYGSEAYQAGGWEAETIAWERERG